MPSPSHAPFACTLGLRQHQKLNVVCPMQQGPHIIADSHLKILQLPLSGLSVLAPPVDHTTRPPNSNSLTTFSLSDCCCKNATSTPSNHCCPDLSHRSTQVPCCCKCLTRSQKSHETRINNPGICTCNCLCGLVGSYSCGCASIKQPFAWKLQPCRQHH